MEFRKLIEIIGELSGLTLEEWRIIREEIDKHYRLKCKRVKIEEEDVQEIARMVSMRRDVYEAKESAPQQTKLSL